jgi:hypothetical protein
LFKHSFEYWYIKHLSSINWSTIIIDILTQFMIVDFNFISNLPKDIVI